MTILIPCQKHILWNEAQNHNAIVVILKIIEQSVLEASFSTHQDQLATEYQNLRNLEQGSLTIQSYNTIFLNQVDHLSKLSIPKLFTEPSDKALLINKYLSSIDEGEYRNAVALWNTNRELPQELITVMRKIEKYTQEQKFEHKYIKNNNTIPTHLARYAVYPGNQNHTTNVFAATNDYSNNTNNNNYKNKNNNKIKQNKTTTTITITIKNNMSTNKITIQ